MYPTVLRINIAPWYSIQKKKNSNVFVNIFPGLKIITVAEDKHRVNQFRHKFYIFIPCANKDFTHSWLLINIFFACHGSSEIVSPLWTVQSDKQTHYSKMASRWCVYFVWTCSVQFHAQRIHHTFTHTYVMRHEHTALTGSLLSRQSVKEWRDKEIRKYTMHHAHHGNARMHIIALVLWPDVVRFFATTQIERQMSSLRAFTQRLIFTKERSLLEFKNNKFYQQRK